MVKNEIANSKVELEFHGVVHSKKNQRQTFRSYSTGRIVNIPSKQARIQEGVMVTGFKAQRIRQRWWRADENATYAVKMVIYQKDRHRRDLDNQMTTILDALVKAGVIPDDSDKYVRRLEVEYGGVDSADPRAIIEIAQYYATLAENAENSNFNARG